MRSYGQSIRFLNFPFSIFLLLIKRLIDILYKFRFVVLGSRQPAKNRELLLRTRKRPQPETEPKKQIHQVTQSRYRIRSGKSSTAMFAARVDRSRDLNRYIGALAIIISPTGNIANHFGVAEGSPEIRISER
jgi:hypothetical protein